MAIISTLMLLYGCSCVSLAEAAPVECHADKEFHVAVKPFKEDSGALFAVTALSGKAAPRTCGFDPKSADFVIGRNGDALWYSDLVGTYLILQRSTGPQGDLVIIDLATRKTILDVPSDDFAREGDTLVFWQRGEEATEKTCASFRENTDNGLGSVISTRKLFSLTTGKIGTTGATRCDAIQ
jgi:hypothetical protein